MTAKIASGISFLPCAYFRLQIKGKLRMHLNYERLAIYTQTNLSQQSSLSIFVFCLV